MKPPRIKTKGGSSLGVQNVEGGEVVLDRRVAENVTSTDVFSPEEATDLARELVACAFRARFDTYEKAERFYKSMLQQGFVEAEEDWEFEEPKPKLTQDDERSGSFRSFNEVTSDLRKVGILDADDEARIRAAREAVPHKPKDVV